MSRPACKSCGTSKHVVRVWAGRHRTWACKIHSKVAVGEPARPTLRQRVFHRLPKETTVALGDMLPNRAARRRSGR